MVQAQYAIVQQKIEQMHEMKDQLEERLKTFERWSDELLVAQGAQGEVCVRGAQVTAEYAFEPAHTRVAKIPDAEGA